MDHLVYNLWILRLFGGIFPKMGFSKVIWWHIPEDGICMVELFEALVLTLQWSFNPASRFVDIIMWRRNFKLDKPPCTTLWCYNNNILSYCLHWWSKVTNVPYRTTSHCWGRMIWIGSDQWTYSYQDGRVMVYHRLAQVRDFQTLNQVYFGNWFRCCNIYRPLNYTHVHMCEKWGTFGQLSASSIGSMATN